MKADPPFLFFKNLRINNLLLLASVYLARVPKCNSLSPFPPRERDVVVVVVAEEEGIASATRRSGTGHQKWSQRRE